MYAYFIMDSQVTKENQFEWIQFGKNTFKCKLSLQLLQNIHQSESFQATTPRSISSPNT